MPPSGRILIYLLLFLIAPGDALAQPAMVLNTANDPPNATADFAGICDLVLKEAFQRLAIPLTIIRLPSERALVNANDGVDDGNFARVAGLSATYPNLVQVPESISSFEFVAITRDRQFTPTDWASLQPYDVAIITGWKILEQNITATKSLTKVDDRHMLFNLLQTGRVDCIVYDRRQALATMKEETFTGMTVHSPAFAVKEMYPYLHKKHESLIPPLAETIHAIKSDGTYDAIVGRVMTTYRVNS